MKNYECYGLYVDDELYEIYDSDSQLNDAIYGIADSRKCSGETVKIEIVGYVHEDDADGDDIPLNNYMTDDFFAKFKGVVSFSASRNIMINKAGGNSGADTVNYRVALPAKMVKAIGVTKDDKSVVLELISDGILIRKA